MAAARFSNSVTVRDHKGRFLARYEEKKRRALEEVMKAGAKRARELAPKGKTLRLSSSINYTVGSSGGSWSVGTGYWGPQEHGARPHSMRGDVTFFWAREGRFWTPGDNLIFHPGNPAVHFMRRSFEETFPTMLDRMKVE